MLPGAKEPTQIVWDREKTKKDVLGSAGLLGPCWHYSTLSVLLMQKQPWTNDCDPIKLSLWTLKFELYTIFTPYQMFSFWFPAPPNHLKKYKPFLANKHLTKVGRELDLACGTLLILAFISEKSIAMGYKAKGVACLFLII